MAKQSKLLWLYGAHFVNLIVPVTATIILARRLGPEGFGVIVFSTALMQFIALFVDFGFHLTVQQIISRSSIRQNAIGDALVRTLMAQLILAVFVGLVVVFGVVGFRADAKISLAVLFAGVVIALNPSWFFRGYQEFAVAVRFETYPRIIGAIGGVLVVHGDGDIWLYFSCVGAVYAGAVFVGYSRIAKRVDLAWPKRFGIVQTIREGLPNFLVHGLGTIYACTPVFLLGIFSSAQMVGSFGAAERIARLSGALFDPIRQLLFPSASALAISQPSAYFSKTKALLIRGLVFAAIGGLALAFFSQEIIFIIYGNKYPQSAECLFVLSVLLVSVVVNLVLGVLWFIPINRQYLLLSTTFIGLLTNVALMALLVPQAGALGAAKALAGAEIVCAVLTVMLFFWTRPRIS